MTEPTPSIVVTAQGPYLVEGGVPLRRRRPVSSVLGEPVAWETTGEVPAEESYALCRCGGSQNKPFCDGTHATRDWDGAEQPPAAPYDERAREYPGEGVTVQDVRGICAHAGFCANKVTNVWKMAAATADSDLRNDMLAMIDRCPSGALQYRLADESAPHEADLSPTVNLVQDGPLWVTGGVQVTRADGTVIETRARLTLCRCAASANKPFCDGSHAATGFRDPA